MLVITRLGNTTTYLLRLLNGECLPRPNVRFIECVYRFKIKAIKSNLCQLHSFCSEFKRFGQNLVNNFIFHHKKSGKFCCSVVFIGQYLGYSLILLKWMMGEGRLPMIAQIDLFFYAQLWYDCKYYYIIRFKWIVCVSRLSQNHLNTRFFSIAPPWIYHLTKYPSQYINLLFCLPASAQARRNKKRTHTHTL